MLGYLCIDEQKKMYILHKYHEIFLSIYTIAIVVIFHFSDAVIVSYGNYFVSCLFGGYYRIIALGVTIIG